jgi:hypothetical protein
MGGGGDTPHGVFNNKVNQLKIDTMKSSENVKG